MLILYIILYFLGSILAYGKLYAIYYEDSELKQHYYPQLPPINIFKKYYKTLFWYTLYSWVGFLIAWILSRNYVSKKYFLKFNSKKLYFKYLDYQIKQSYGIIN